MVFQLIEKILGMVTEREVVDSQVAIFFDRQLQRKRKLLDVFLPYNQNSCKVLFLGVPCKFFHLTLLFDI